VPIVIVIEEARARLTEQELIAAERHLTVTLSDRHVKALKSIQAQLPEADSVEAIIDLVTCLRDYALRQWLNLECARTSTEL
jgi:predicted protein tyrosine phosphatase